MDTNTNKYSTHPSQLKQGDIIEFQDEGAPDWRGPYTIKDFYPGGFIEAKQGLPWGFAGKIFRVYRPVPRTKLPSLSDNHVDPRDLKPGDWFRYKHFRETCWSDPLKVLRLNRADQFIHIDDNETDITHYGVESGNKFCRFSVNKPQTPGPTGAEGPKGPGPGDKGCLKPHDRDVTGAPLPDSGQRTKFATGAVRDAAAGKGCPSMVPPESLRRVWRLYEKGSIKYNDSPGDLNYKKGIALSRMFEAIMRHANSAAEGDDTQDHLASIVWNAFTWMWTEKEIREGRLPSELFDLPFHKDFVTPDNFVVEMQNVGMADVKKCSMCKQQETVHGHFPYHGDMCSGCYLTSLTFRH